MKQEIEKLKQEFKSELATASETAAVEAVRVKYLGRKAAVNGLFMRMAGLPHEEKAACGRALNQLKQFFAGEIEAKTQAFCGGEEKIDLTFPGELAPGGSRHVLSAVIEAVCDIFEKIGFTVAWGDEVEDEWHNFAALNFPVDHPSRDDFDTFYLDLPPASKRSGKYLLRCHTSPSQPRIMKEHKPPLAVISPGRVYRPDQVDATHSFMFSQIEGFAVARDIDFAHLKGTLLHFARSFFSPDVKMRLRPHFFPFTEPSAEADISCFMCKGKKQADENPRSPGGGVKTPRGKCSVCKDKGWIEVLGCGMIHPNVLEACGIDSKEYQGFAFGMGVERIAMLKYGVNDIRLFYENDKRFLEQF